MDTKSLDRESILVIDEVEETRDAIEKLLTADGYRVSTSRDEQGAIELGRRHHPELILMSRGTQSSDVIATVRRIRDHVRLDRTVPVVIFSVETIAEGAEVDIGENTHLAHPDNFDQLRRLVRRLLHKVRYLS
jgi:CheY-like chemotaxis protein